MGGILGMGLASIIYVLPAVVLVLTVHEFSHGLMAYAFGDPTAKSAGRLSLNPLRHLDVMGTLALLFFGFGWAKPVPVNAYYFQGDRRNKMIAVALAGPGSNLLFALLLAFLLSLALRFSLLGNNSFSSWLAEFLLILIQINISLAVFNLLPVPPLDGSRVLLKLLPNRHINTYFWLERYGFLILIICMYLGLFDRVISPIVRGIFTGIMSLVGLM